MEKRLSILNGVHTCPRAVAHWSRPEPARQLNDTSRVQSTFKGCANESPPQKPVLSVKDFSPPNLLKTFPPAKNTLFRNNSFEGDNYIKEMLFTEETSVFGDQKSLLKGFQTIEMIDSILMKLQNGKGFNELDSGYLNFIHTTLQIRLSPATHFSSQIMRTMAFYRDKLISLLKERCYIGLQKDCVLHIKELKCFVTELVALKCDESEKLKFHLQGKGKSISNLYFGKPRKLLEHLENHCSRWSMVLQRVNRMISVFHVNWDSRLNEMLAYSERMLKALLVEAFYWAFRILQDNFKVLCSKDQHSLPSDVLQNFYNSLEAFNILLKNQFHTSDHFSVCRECKSSDDSPQCVFYRIQCFSNKFALTMLATFQSNIASGNILDVLTAKWRNCESWEMEQGINWLTEIQDFEKLSLNNHISTSDYYTMSENESTSNTKDSSDSNNPDDSSAFSLNAALVKVIQRNQTSLLKHLFAMTCIGRTFEYVGSVKGKQPTGARQKWPKAKPKSGSESSSHLEQVYWLNFWQKLEEDVLKLTLFSSGHSLKNSRLGSTAFLPLEFVLFICKTVKDTRSDMDLCPEAIKTLHNISQNLYIGSALGSWDKSFCKSLQLSMGHLYSPVPLANGYVGTNVGKVFSCTLETVACLTLSAHSLSEDSTTMIAICCLQCTVDYILTWISSRLTSFLNSWNIATFLLIGLTDLTKCYSLLVTLADLVKAFQESRVPEHWHSFWNLNVQIKCFEEIMSSMDEKVFRKSYMTCCDIFEKSLPKKNYWKRRKLESKLATKYKEVVIEKVLEPALNALSRVAASSRIIVTNRISCAFTQAWIDSLLKKRTKFSSVGAYQLKCDLHSFFKWINEAQLAAEIKSNFLRSDGILKLNAITKVLSEDKIKIGSAIKVNRVAPTAEDEIELFDALPGWNLLASEVLVWKSLKISSPCLCLLCWT